MSEANHNTNIKESPKNEDSTDVSVGMSEAKQHKHQNNRKQHNNTTIMRKSEIRVKLAPSIIRIEK